MIDPFERGDTVAIISTGGEVTGTVMSASEDIVMVDIGGIGRTGCPIPAHDVAHIAGEHDVEHVGESLAEHVGSVDNLGAES